MVSRVEEVETRVHLTAHDRIRDLPVREDHGRILVRGQVPSHHVKQVALHGVLKSLSGDCLRAEIAVR